MIAYRYKKEKARNGETIFRPVADVILKSSYNTLEASMYIDSGADISFVTLSAGLALGFTEKSNQIKEVKGFAGEAIPYILQEITFILSGHKILANIGWALIEEVPFLLGRAGIFSKFKITFDESEKLIYFIPKHSK